MDEALALLTTLEATAPHAPTACAGWSAHDVVAHLAAGAAEMATITEAVVAGGPAPDTAPFATREAPYAALPDEELRARLVTEALRLDAAIGALGPGATVSFSGRRLGAGELTVHGRSEAAIHRWDLAGDDDVGDELLADAALTAHAVTVLNGMVVGSPEEVGARAGAAGITSLRATFGAPGQPDVVLVVDGAGARLELDDPSPRPTVRAEAPTRLLALWGRRSRRRLSWTGDDSGTAEALASFLWGRPTALSETR